MIEFFNDPRREDVIIFKIALTCVGCIASLETAVLPVSTPDQKYITWAE